MSISFKSRIEEVVARLSPALRQSEEKNLLLLQNAGVTSYENLLIFTQDTQQNPELRQFAIWLLARLDDTKAVPSILNALTDTKHSVVRREAALRVAEIGKLGAPEAISPLLNVLQTDPDAQVRAAAAYALRRFKGTANEMVVVTLLNTLQNQQEDAAVRGEAAESLGELGAHQAVPALIAALQDPAANIRLESAFALGLIGDTRALPELTYVAATDQGQVLWGGPEPWLVKDEANEAIMRIQN